MFNISANDVKEFISISEDSYIYLAKVNEYKLVYSTYTKNFDIYLSGTTMSIFTTNNCDTAVNYFNSLI